MVQNLRLLKEYSLTLVVVYNYSKEGIDFTNSKEPKSYTKVLTRDKYATTLLQFFCGGTL